MNKIYSPLKKAILPLIFILVGVIAGALLTLVTLLRFDLKIDNEITFNIDIFGILSIVITALLAIYVTSELTKKVQDNRSVKNLAIRRMGNMEKLFVEKLREIYKKPELDFVKKSLNNFRVVVRLEQKLLSERDLILHNNNFPSLIEVVDSLWSKLLLIEVGGGGGVTFDSVTNCLVFSDVEKEFIIQTSNEISVHIFNIQNDISVK